MIENKNIKMGAGMRGLIYSLITGSLATLTVFVSFFITTKLYEAVSVSVSFFSVINLIISIFVFGIVGMVAGFAFGLIIDLLLQKTNLAKNENSLINRTVLILIIMSLFFAYFSVTKRYQDEKKYLEKYDNVKNPEGIKYDTGIIEKKLVDKNNLKNYNLDLNKEHAIGYSGGENTQDQQKELTWNSKKYVVANTTWVKTSGDGHILIKNDDGSIFIDHSLAQYKYLDGISYIILENGGKSYLFFLSRLQPTSGQSVLSVFSEDGKLLYEELMKNADSIELGDFNGEKVIVTGAASFVNGNPRVFLNDTIYKIKK